MAQDHEIRNMAVFCDFENIALGVEDAKYDKFDIGRVLEKLLVKGSIVVKKAYCDWDRYKQFKVAMHGASFELIEIPQRRQSGKNSADIRMVVDALDLCYTKAHVDTFVIISGDSDFSPLVSKLRENAKTVIGVGVKNSTSDLLLKNCDEFIFYDDLVRAEERAKKARSATKKKSSARKRTAPDAAGGAVAKDEVPDGRPDERVEARDDAEGDADSDAARIRKALDLVVGTLEALASERGEDDKVWGSAVKQALKRRNPGFNETYYGFKSFSKLLEEAAARRMLTLERDDKSGGYVVRPIGGEA